MKTVPAGRGMPETKRPGCPDLFRFAALPCQYIRGQRPAANRARKVGRHAPTRPARQFPSHQLVTLQAIASPRRLRLSERSATGSPQPLIEVWTLRLSS